MLVDRETLYQLALAGGAVVLFVVGAAVVTGLYSSNGGLTETGGLALVGVIALFVLAMLGAGLWLETQEFEEPGAAEAVSDGGEAADEDE